MRVCVWAVELYEPDLLATADARTVINYGGKPRPVINLCSREELRLIQLNGPRADAHPICEARWSLQRVVAFARQKITQAELCRVVVHQTVKSIARSRLHSRRPPAKLIILWFTRFLTKWSAASVYRGVPSRGSQCSGCPNSGQDFSTGANCSICRNTPAYTAVA